MFIWIVYISGAAVYILHAEVRNGNPIIRVQCSDAVLLRLGHTLGSIVSSSSRAHCVACQLGGGKLRKQPLPRPVCTLHPHIFHYKCLQMFTNVHTD